MRSGKKILEKKSKEVTELALHAVIEQKKRSAQTK